MAMGDFFTKCFVSSSSSGLPTAPASPNDDGKEVEDISSLSEKLAATSLKRKAGPEDLTPPWSSAASASSSTQTDPLDGRPGSTGSSEPWSIVERQLSTSDGLFLPNHRVTSGLNPLSAVTTKPSAPTPQLSNPTSHRSSTSPDSPTRSSQDVSAQSALVSCLENVKLTDGVALSRKKTPPRTPRALSSNGSDHTRSSATAIGTPRSNQSPARDPKTGNSPFRLPRGRLLVRVSEARGLRPSHDPYAVCVFEWNESIAKNEGEPTKDKVIRSREPSRGREASLGGVHINRSASDMGRSMAIPMKSRQSSTTSLSDKKQFKTGNTQVTYPRWDHETIL